MTRFCALLGLLLALAVGCGDKQEAANQSAGSDQLAAVIKGLDNPFFQTMRDGLVATARRHGAPLRVEAAAGLEDVAGQASKLESLSRAKAACYVVNPINATNLIQPLADVPKGAPIVNIDSPVDADAARAVGVKLTTYVGTDNVAAGRAGAAAMARFVDDGATVAVVTGIPGDVSSRDRTDGFMDGAAGRFAVGPTVPADFDRDRARVAAAELLRTSPGIRGFFAVNDEMALGIADAVRAGGRRGDVAVIGVDGILEALAGIRRGAMSATVAQYPYTIGQLGIEACLAATGGAALPSRIDSPVQVVTKSNVARAQANFPKPVERFNDPIARLVDGER
jgi:ABC-type sugar transport system substrate-binding protein